VGQQLKIIVCGRTISLLRLAVLLLPAAGAAADESVFSEDDLKIPLWNYSTELRGAFGYKDNVTLSHTNAQGSAFWMSSAEFMAFRLPTDGWQFHFFADASDVRYFDSPSVDNEQVALAAARVSKDFGHGWKSSVGLNYLFQNQVFDFSDVYTNQSSVGQIVGHTLTPRWAVRKTIGAFWIEGEFNGTRQWLDAPLDSYWQFGPRVAVAYEWGRGSEVGLSWQYSRLDYDSRVQVDRLGGALTNTSLALNSHSAELSLTHVWDEKRRWQTASGIGYEAGRDNGSGFYDYDSVRVSQQVRYRDEHWEATLQARASHFRYATQTVSATDADARRKTMLNITLRIERKLAKHLKAHASYSWDRSISNLDFDDYAASTVMGGLAVQF
jgi:hypothetical protein